MKYILALILILMLVSVLTSCDDDSTIRGNGDNGIYLRTEDPERMKDFADEYGD